MNDVEARVRATLHAVAQATPTDRMASYVEAPPAPRSRRPLLLLAAAAAVLAVVGAAVGLRPDPTTDTPPPPPAAAPTTPPGPEGGRLVAEGTFGAERWALYGVDRLPTMNEPRCFALVVPGREHTPRGCGFEADTPGRSVYWQLGPAMASGDDVLVLGVLDFDVTEVVVEYRTTKRQASVVPLPDPAYPDGARYFTTVVPRSEREVELRFHAADGQVLRVSEMRVDGPVGG